MKRMMYWQIGMILLVSVAFYLSQLFGFEYRQGLFAAAIAATAATCGAIAAVAAELPDPSSDPFVLRRARHAVSGVIAAAAPAAVAWFLMVPRAGFISFLPSQAYSQSSRCGWPSKLCKAPQKSTAPSRIVGSFAPLPAW